MDVADRVVETGKAVTSIRLGDEVFGTCEGGSFAEYACVSQHKLVLKPANLTLEQAAAVPISGATGLQALRDKGQLQPGQQVLIIGAGGRVGTFAVQLAKAFGADVTGVCSTTKADLVRSIGAYEVIDYTLEDFARKPQRYHLILDAAGLRRLSHLRHALTPRGTFLIIGGEGGGRLFGGVDRILRAKLLAPFVGQKLRGMVGAERKEDLEFLAQLIEAGRVTLVIDKTYPAGPGGRRNPLCSRRSCARQGGHHCVARDHLDPALLTPVRGLGSHCARRIRAGAPDRHL
jgi:NADPH:quinone reductase-like Zn-dependent oxidoreductase